MAESKNQKKAAAAAAPVIAEKNETPQALGKAKKISRWTQATCHNAAKRFTNRETWAKNNPASYKAAAAKGWLEACCAHMTAAPVNSRAKKSA